MRFGQRPETAVSGRSGVCFFWAGVFGFINGGNPRDTRNHSIIRNSHSVGLKPVAVIDNIAPTYGAMSSFDQSPPAATPCLLGREGRAGHGEAISASYNAPHE